MTLSPAIIDAMVAAGCTAEQLAAVVKAAMADDNARVTAKREKDADRQRRHRASRNVTVTECDKRDEAPLSSPPNDIYSNPPHHTPQPKKPARGCRLPESWEPNPLPANLAAAVLVWPAGKIERELARFRDWAASASGSVAVKSDWDAAWRNWLRKADETQGKSSNVRTGNSTASAAQRALALIEGRGG